MSPNPHRLAALDAAIADCALDAMLARNPQTSAPSQDDAIPEPTYDHVEVELRTWSYRAR